MKITIDINAKEYGFMLQAKDHLMKGGLHPSGWNSAWKAWVKEQQKNNSPINPETMEKQLKIMEKKYEEILSKGKKATESFDDWHKRLAKEKAAKEIIEKERKEAAEKVAKEASEGAIKKGAKKIAKKGTKLAIKGVTGGLATVPFFLYDWYDTGSFGGAVNEAAWPFSMFWSD